MSREKALLRQKVIRERYLDYLAGDVEQRWKSSIHVARFLDIGLDEKLNATATWHYKAFDGPQRFTDFDQAFSEYKGRVLLLGPPGSGKSTTLLNLAQRLITAAQQDPDQPLPLLFNLSKFGSVSSKRISEQLKWLRKKKDPGELDPAQVFEQWLVQMLVEMRIEGLNRQTAQQWVNDGEIALLLDGLDEVSDTHIVSLAKIMNEAYFLKHQRQTVVVCSRIIEYQPLQENKEARLRLNGAVVLQPPSREQIDSYLEHARAFALRDALRDDEVLYEMAQSPLTLSMMTLAYGGEAPTDIPHDLPFLERRRKLLDTYVERMVQRTARREKGVPFDLNPDNDVATAYPLDETNHYLGWLAIKLSERMRTLFPLPRLYSFLKQQQDAVDLRSFFTQFGVDLIALWVVAFITTGALVIQSNWPSKWLWLAVIPLLAPATFVIASVRRPRYRDDWFETLRFVGIAAFTVGCAGLVTTVVVTLVQITPIVPSTLIVSMIMFGALLWPQEGRTSNPLRYVLRRALKLAIPLAVTATIISIVAGDLKYGLYVVAIASSLIIFFWLRKSEFKNSPFWSYLLLFVGLTFGAIFLPTFAAWWIDVHHFAVLVFALPILLGILFYNDEWIGTSLSVAIAAIVANLVGGANLAVFAVVMVLVFHLGWMKNEAARAIEWLLLNPVLRLSLAIGGGVCFRYKVFLDYASNTMLLKHVGTEYEFVHRLLRDHFAIRELIPALYKAEGVKRIAVIQQLSRQGDSSFDALSSLTTNSDPHVRRAAIEGLGRIAIPRVLPIMLDRLENDPDEGVRSAVIYGVMKFSRGEQEQIFEKGMQDSSADVRRAVVENSQNDRQRIAALFDRSDIVYRTALIVLGQHEFFYFLEAMKLDSVTINRLSESVLDPDGDLSVGAAIVLRTFYMQKTQLTEQEVEVLARTVIPAFLTRCRDRNSKVRGVMIRCLASLAETTISSQLKEQLKGALLEAINDKDRNVKKEAIDGLAALNDADTRAALRLAVAQKDLESRRLIIEKLGTVGDKLAVPALMEQLSDPELRSKVAESLGRIGDESIVPTLLELLEQERHEIPAIMALADLNVKSAIPKFRELFRRQPTRTRRYFSFFYRAGSEDVRSYAAFALGRVEDVGFGPELAHISPHEPLEMFFGRIYALRRLGLSLNIEALLSQSVDELRPREKETLRNRIAEYLSNASFENPPKPVEEDLKDLVIGLVRGEHAWEVSKIWNRNDRSFFTMY